jgi:hypothetical protein
MNASNSCSSPAHLLTQRQFAEYCQLSLRMVGILIAEHGASPGSGVIRFGRSVRIKPEIFLETIARHRARSTAAAKRQNGKGTPP